MNKTDLEALTSIRLSEAKCLLANGLHHGAYYLCGYAIECALKACIAKNVIQHEFPNKKLANDSHNHDLIKLMQVANLQQSYNTLRDSDSQFEINWAIVKDWNEQFRYDQHISPSMAQQIINAIEDNNSGVLQWVKRHW